MIFKKKSLSVVILIGGSGSRFSSMKEEPKQLSKLNNEHILIHIIASVLAIELLLHIDLGRPPPQDSGSEYHEHDKAARSSQDPW